MLTLGGVSGCTPRRLQGINIQESLQSSRQASCSLRWFSTPQTRFVNTVDIVLNGDHITYVYTIEIEMLLPGLIQEVVSQQL